MKKLFLAITSLFLTIAAINFSVVSVFAEEEKLQSKSVYLCDYNSGTVIKAKNETARLPIASMCKIMTLLLIFEEIDSGNLTFDENITVSSTASGMGGSQVFLEAGSEYPAKELIKSIIIASANDSCVAFAEKISGSERDFVDKMNAKARSLGMKNTLFSNCTGLPKPTQYSCARDVSVMFNELIGHEEYFKFSNIWMDEIAHPKDRKTGLTNTNKLIRFYEGCDGGKTGYTSEAGHCLAATAKRGGMRLVSVVISSPDSATRFKETTDMFNYGFANFTNRAIVEAGKPLSIDAKVYGGKDATVGVVAERDFYAFSKKNTKENFRLDFCPKDKIKAPVKKGDAVGELVVYKDNQEVARIPCAAQEDIDKKTYFDYIRDVAYNW